MYSMWHNPRYYILGGDDGETLIAVNMEEGIDYLSIPEFRRIKQSVYENVTVSTIFLGVDHNFSDYGDPILFETLVMGGALDETMYRYHTFREAVAGHITTCALVEAAIAMNHSE